ncbi:phosphonate ABC transporter ATP-binding protein [Glaciimonas immobilis]|uniref:Phosphonate transport system ATP-binding protein n=1 Tax=Glaciimonas immobilis TaxID=728004 RepID=A0A840RVA2_9BURK|nr:ATP-binding cassette domain-containing protein [Glaciimonas immobilis]KAF3996532.1 ATP-binding cassette domain-containing protein [Glaciimonas immobilis]MBB5201102.1 phosphonate transport system ATP-binding protein [Glaciimonas immobilis]
MNKKTIIALREVVCVAGDRAILEIDNLNIMEGERIAVLGANGAGKSTLLRLIGGLVCPHHGVVQVLNRSLGDPLAPKAQRALRRDVGQIMQGLHLVPRLTAIENVLIGCLGRVSGWRSWVRWYPPEEVEEAKAALKAVGMVSRADTKADRLSGGERQKVAIARLLMQGPRLILADEPTAALDPAAAADVCQLLVRAATGATLITVVHNPSLLPVLADRAIGIQHGVIVFDCPVAEVTDARLVNLYRPGERKQARFSTIAGGQLVSQTNAAK